MVLTGEDKEKEERIGVVLTKEEKEKEERIKEKKIKSSLFFSFNFGIEYNKH